MASGDVVQRWWRPIYAFELTLECAVCWALATWAVNALGLLSLYWGPRFGVLGVYVNGRSREKKAALTGQPAPTAINPLVKAAARKVRDDHSLRTGRRGLARRCRPPCCSCRPARRSSTPSETSGSPCAATGSRPCLRHLRRDRRRRLRRLATPRCPARNHRVHRTAGMGSHRSAVRAVGITGLKHAERPGPSWVPSGLRSSTPGGQNRRLRRLRERLALDRRRRTASVSIT